jgi:hypothetical protein
MAEDLPEIRYQPTDGSTHNPNEDLYWDRSALEKELVRSFELAMKNGEKAFEGMKNTAGELSATLMPEYETAEERAHHLDELVGLDRHLWLQVGNAEPVAAQFDNAQMSPTNLVGAVRLGAAG